MLPLGHLGVGLGIGAAFRRRASLCALLLGALLPDLDFIFLFHQDFNLIHRTYTHTLYFVCLSSLAVYLITMRSPANFLFSLQFFLAAVSHLIIDSIFDNNPSNGLGLPLFAPFSYGYIQILSTESLLSATAPGWDHPQLMLAQAFKLLWLELLLLLLGILSFRRFVSSQRSS